LVAAFAARDPHVLLRPGGALALGLALRWGVGIGEREACDLRRLDLERGLGHRPLREADRVTRRRVDWFREWIDHPARDSYWDARTPALPAAPPASLLVAGWRHPALGAQLADFATLRENALRSGAPAPELVVGPWPGGSRSGPPHAQRPDAELARRSTSARRVRDEPGGGPVRVFVRGSESWLEASAWPLPGAEATAFHLHGGGSANGRTGDGGLAREAPADAQPADGFEYDPRDPVLTEYDSEECRNDVLCYTTQGMPAPITLGGPVRAVLFAASSAAITDFTATLVALAADGKPRSLCEGVLRSRGEPGERRRLELDLGAICARLETGERLRLAVSSSAFPRWDRPSHSNVQPGLATQAELATAQQTLYHDREHPSHVVLPLLPASLSL
jgi:putative CocE/NonD family hydrolase